MLRVVRGAFEALCGALCCGSSGMSHAIPSHVCRGLKSDRWDCNVRGGAAESSVARIACDLWVVRPWIELLCSFVGPRVLPTIPGVRQACARQACARRVCCVAGRGRGVRVGNQRRCRLGLRGGASVGWWCGSGREPCVGSRPGLLSGKSAVGRDISTDSIQQGKDSIQRAEKRPETVESLAASVGVLWRCPTLPQPIGCSTIGAAGLSFQVRNVAGRFPGAVTTTRLFVQHHPPPCLCAVVGRWGGVG